VLAVLFRAADLFFGMCLADTKIIICDQQNVTCCNPVDQGKSERNDTKTESDDTIGARVLHTFVLDTR
jgi:hypothetical protein